LLFATVGFYAVTVFAGPAEDEIAAAFEDLRLAVLENDAETIYARLSPEHPLRVDYPTEDALAAAMWVYPITAAEREAVEGLEIAYIVRSDEEKDVYVVTIRTIDGEDFVLYAEEAGGRWVFR
jgi:hypothetical protein